ncbi:MAG: hypothetical protein ABI054_02900 [Planctomycetota bacterium]
MTEKASKPPFKWGFASAGGVILLMLVVGQVAGNLLSRWPPTRGLLRSMGAFSGQGRFEGGVMDAMRMKDWLFAAFLLAAIAVAWINRRGILRFFRTMQTGVMLIVLTTIAILTGVLVPQIEGFEDPEQHVSATNRAKELYTFEGAEGYFLYHLTHLYGIGMPKAELPPGAAEGLVRFGRVYGEEEEKNRKVQMIAAVGGMAKTQEIEDFIKSHRSALATTFNVCTALDLNRTYKSSWFATLIWMLGIGVLINTLRYPLRVLFSVEKAGFFVTHVGMLTLLSGGMVSNLFTDRGILELRLGDPPEDTYFRHYRFDKRARMPFAVKLDRFARKEWKAIDVQFFDAGLKSNPPRYTVWDGRTIPLDWQPDAQGKYHPQIELRVREVHDHARVNEPLVHEGKPDDGGPSLAIAQFDAPLSRPRGMNGEAPTPAQTPTERHTLYAPSNQLWIDPEAKFRLGIAHGIDPKAAFPAEGDDAFGTLWVDVLTEGREEPRPFRVHIGDQLKLGGGFELIVRNATRNFDTKRDTDTASKDPLPLAEQLDGFRAAWIEIVPPGGKEREVRLVSQDLDPVEYGLQEKYKYKEVVVRLRWDSWSEVGPPRYIFSWDAAGNAKLTPQSGPEIPVTIGQALDLPGNARLVLQALFERARFENSIDFLPSKVEADGFDPAFYESDARGIVLDVVHFPHTDKERIETVRMATSDDAQADRWQSGDDRFAIRFLENVEGFPFDWRSVLSIVEKDANGNPTVVDCGTLKEREIRVNDYFKYKGYRFFQTNANPKDPTYSGIGVVYDPGIELVLLGMYTIIAGTILAFTVRPIVRAQRRAKVSS